VEVIGDPVRDALRALGSSLLDVPARDPEALKEAMSSVMPNDQASLDELPRRVANGTPDHRPGARADGMQIDVRDAGTALYIAVAPGGAWAETTQPDELITVDWDADGGLI